MKLFPEIGTERNFGNFSKSSPFMNSVQYCACSLILEGGACLVRVESKLEWQLKVKKGRAISLPAP